MTGQNHQGAPKSVASDTAALLPEPSLSKKKGKGKADADITKNYRRGGKSPGTWGNPDSFRDRILVVQGGLSQFENIFERNIQVPLFSEEFVEQLTKEHLELFEKTNLVVKLGGIIASRFVSRGVIRDILGIGRSTDAVPAHQGWRFVLLLEGPLLEAHFRDTGDFNIRNGICATEYTNDLMNTFKLSYVPLTPDDPKSPLSSMQYLLVPHRFEAAEKLIDSGYQIGRRLTLNNHSDFEKGHKYLTLADREDLPDPVNMMFHHRSCSIYTFVAAAEPLDLEIDREEEFRSLNTIKCREWLSTMESSVQLEQYPAHSTQVYQPPSYVNASTTSHYHPQSPPSAASGSHYNSFAHQPIIPSSHPTSTSFANVDTRGRFSGLHQL